MDDFRGLRIALIIVMWATIGGGLLLTTLWVAFGGGRAIGPDDIDDRRIDPARPERRTTSFSGAHIGLHGLLGVLTAALVTYAAVRTDDRPTGYVAGIIAIVITAIPGVVLYRLWSTRSRAGAGGVPPHALGEGRVEDRLPAPLVYLHGLAALSTVALLAVLLAVD